MGYKTESQFSFPKFLGRSEMCHVNYNLGLENVQPQSKVQS